MAIPKKQTEYERPGEPEPALIQGRLKFVNLRSGTAGLDAFSKKAVPLRFDSSLGREMLRLESKLVKVKGHGWISDEDEWIVINVEEITDPSSEMRTTEEILNDPNPKLFDSDTVPRASEHFDVEEFIRVIRESRSVGRKEEVPE